MRNAEIAAALTELGTLYELDGANRFRVLAYREAARVIRESPASVEELAPRRQGDRAPGDRQDDRRRRSSTLLDEGEIPAAAS